MTVIVGLRADDGVYLGCDSQGSAGWNKTHRKDPKIFIAHGIGYGFTSSYRMGQIIRYHSTEVLSNLRESDLYGYVVTGLVPMYRQILGDHGYKATVNGEESGGTFLIAIDGRLFKIEGDFQVAESHECYDSVGCGASFALGSLYTQDKKKSPKNIIKEAIESAMNFSNGCGGNILTLKISP